LWVSAVKESHPTEHFWTISWNPSLLEITGKAQQEFLTIAGSILAMLLELDDVRANEPVAHCEIAIDRTSDTRLGASMYPGNRGNERLITHSSWSRAPDFFCG
jgi:hypothetical protein